MYRVKQLSGGSQTLRDYDGQVAKAMAMVRALNKMTKSVQTPVTISDFSCQKMSDIDQDDILFVTYAHLRIGD